MDDKLLRHTSLGVSDIAFRCDSSTTLYFVYQRAVRAIPCNKWEKRCGSKIKGVIKRNNKDYIQNIK